MTNRPYRTAASLSDALLDTWASRGFELRPIEKKGAERVYERAVYAGTDDVALIAYFRLKVDKTGCGFFEFGLQLSWPRLHALRSRVKPPRFPESATSKATPSIATTSIVREPGVFSRTTPILFDALTSENLDQVLVENRDAYLERAVPKLRHLCSPEGLCQLLRRPDWRETLFMPAWMVPVVFAAAGDEASLSEWARSNEGEVELLHALRDARENGAG